jgi:hypothetical protein
MRRKEIGKMKSVKSLSKRQVALLLEVWDVAHRAIDKNRQPFSYQVDSVDNAEWEDLIDNGYIEPIPDAGNRYVMTRVTDDILDDLEARFTNH